MDTCFNLEQILKLKEIFKNNLILTFKLEMTENKILYALPLSRVILLILVYC